MSLREVYENYLANPSSGALSENATLNYIPTLTTITSSAAIAKHNAAHLNVVKKKSEKIIDCVVGGNAVSLDIETTLEFVTGGGAYLPGLDDNFVSDRVVTFPMVRQSPIIAEILTKNRCYRYRYILYISTRTSRSNKSVYTGTKVPS